MTDDARVAPVIPAGPARPGGPPDWMARLCAAVHGPDADYFRRHHPRERANQGRASAVLMLWGPAGPSAADGEDVILTQRTPHLRSHAGQVSFPGGRLDPEDDGPVAAALREAHEEVGLDAAGVQVVDALPELYLSASSSCVTPVLAWWETPGEIHARSEEEVARVARVPVAALTDPANRFTAVHPSGYRSPGWDIDGLFIWGFTAKLLTVTLDLAGLDPGGWDRTVARDVPDQGGPRRAGRGGMPGTRA